MLHPQRFYNIVVLHEHLQAKISGPVSFLRLIPWEKPSNLAKTSGKKPKTVDSHKSGFSKQLFLFLYLYANLKILGVHRHYIVQETGTDVLPGMNLI